MKIELLFWDGCPSHPEALELLRSVMDERGIAEPIELVEVHGRDDAVALAFPGSPTIRVDGRDIDPAGASEPPSLTCRVYVLEDGKPSPVPSRRQIEEAIS